MTGSTDGLSLAAEQPADFNAAKRRELQNQIDFMEQTDMAVIVSPQQNEIETFKDKGLDIERHRTRMVKEDTDLADRHVRVSDYCQIYGLRETQELQVSGSGSSTV